MEASYENDVSESKACFATSVNRHVARSLISPHGFEATCVIYCSVNQAPAPYRLEALSDPCETSIALFSNFGKIFDPNLPLLEVNIVALYLLKTKNNNCVWKELIHGPDDRRRLYSRVALRLQVTLSPQPPHRGAESKSNS
jgi:hypothetical protein